MSDGSTRRIQSDQGVLQAWHGSQFQQHLQADWLGYGGSPLGGTILRAGATGDKLVAKMQLDTASFAAVFKRSTLPGWFRA